VHLFYDIAIWKTDKVWSTQKFDSRYNKCVKLCLSFKRLNSEQGLANKQKRCLWQHYYTVKNASSFFKQMA